ncbi:hypothetical protein [Peristeroidobacter agariperforans]|uniref:hypothetical protein n=1 Tax=Peristeroidobacter agariperforans TaxID=268404 RepID=UPI00130047A9|nr:hypothetical protein [Peristeroidobacter agariperforans]
MDQASADHARKKDRNEQSDGLGMLAFQSRVFGITGNFFFDDPEAGFSKTGARRVALIS